MRARLSAALDDGDLQPVFAALFRRLCAVASANDPPLTEDPLFSLGDRIVDTARRFTRSPALAASLAQGSRYRSLNPAIALVPPGRPKAALFLGDVLHAAGFQVPTETRAGQVSYRDLARWREQLHHFAVIADDDARPGDLLVPSGDRAAALLMAVGAEHILTTCVGPSGLRESERPLRALCGAVLRPVLRLGEP